MKSFLLKHRLIIVLLILVTLLHIYKLGQIPKILNPDEASIGYNALLLKETGKDEWGKTWPLVLDAFGDQKLIGYPALVSISFWIFGYADWVVKIPSLIAGTLLVLLAYVLQQQLGKSKKQALLTAGLIAIVPVFFFYSRVAFEAMVALVLLLTGISLLISSQTKKKLRDILLRELIACLLFSFALLTYNSPVLLIPIILVFIVINNGLFNWKKWCRVVAIISLIWIGFFIYFLPLTQQKSKITLFADETTMQEYGAYRSQFQGLWSSLLGNKYLFLAEKMAVNYYNSWTPGFLMNNIGGHPWHTMQGFGYLYWTIFACGLMGIFLSFYSVLRSVILTKKYNPRELALLLLFLGSLFPAIITVNAPQATRSLLFFFLWCFYASSGMLSLSSFLALQLSRGNKNLKSISEKMVLGVICIVIIGEATNYFHYYFVTYDQKKEAQSMFQPGFDKVIQKIDSEYPDPIAIVDERGFNYILLAWYLKMAPSQYFSTVKKQLPDKINFKYGEQIGRYHFVARPADRRLNEKVVIEWDSSQNEWKVLYF